MIEKILSDRYEIQETVGTGGMSIVYRAWDPVEKRDVAIKVLRDEYSLDKDFIHRFEREAAAAAKMSHENIVRVYDVGQDGDVRYIVMEYVKGSTLKELIRQKGRIEMPTAIKMTLRILAALDCAHRNHIIHRDIKPQNILVDSNGTIKVADFGIARVTNGTTLTYHTTDQSVIGSVHYFSPEQASGQVADEKSDLYSVGVVLFEMLTGQVLFDGDTPISIALKHVKEEPRSAREIAPENVSKAVDEVLKKALGKEANCRYQNAGEMANDLKMAIKHPAGGFIKHNLTQSELAELEEKRRKRKRMVKYIRNGTIAALVIAILFGTWLIFNDIYGKTKILLPNYCMMQIDEAKENLHMLGIEYTIEERHDDTIGVGYVIDQEPDANVYVRSGDRIQLIVSLGRDKLMMPKLLDLSRTEAVRLIEDNELQLEDVVVEISDAEAGTVIAQDPAVNDWVQPGDGVTLHISGESAQMPNVIGMTSEEATSLLLSSGYKVVTDEVYDDVEKSTVTAQSIEPDTKTLLGTEITLTVSVPAPVTYHAQLTFEMTIPENGAHVICTLEEKKGEREVYNEQLSESQTIRLDLTSYEEGSHTLRVYCGDKLLVETQVDFKQAE